MRATPRALGFAAWLACAPGAMPVRAAPWDHLAPLCLEEVLQVPERVGRIPIPLGCEVIDCCPGCPAGAGPRVLDWRVSVAGRALASVAIEFEDPAVVASLRIEGDAHAAQGGAVVGRAGATLRNLRADGDRAPVAFLRLTLDSAAIAALQEQSIPVRSADAPDLDAIEISIDQLLGPVPVNEFRLRHALRRCRFPSDASCTDDTVVQQDNRGSDASVILLDGNRAGVCSNDELYRADATAVVGNLSEPASCNTDLAVFSEGDAMELRPSVTSWTNACGDRMDVQLAPILTVPVYVWLTDASLAKTADDAIATANAIYDENKTGIRFSKAQSKVVGGLTDRLAVDLGCAAARNLPGSVRVANQLNAYFIDLPSTGESCAPEVAAVFIGTLANAVTLAHEFGHVLSLFGDETTGGHVNGLEGFGADNVMWGGGSAARKYFSLGQAFRFNIDDRSLLNAPGGVRTGPRWRCEALASSPACPELRLDWVRP